MASSEQAVLGVGVDDERAGVWAPALTPLDRNLVPDSKRYVAHLKRLLSEGCHGVVMFGTTGEAPSFSVDERMAVLESVLAAGGPPERLMIGTGCCALSDTLSLTSHATQLLCKRVLMLPPFYYKGVGDEGLYASYATVIDQVGDPGLEVYLYHFPRLSGVPITHGLVERLLKAYPKNLKGIKDSSGDADSCSRFIRGFHELEVYPGTETLMLDMLKRGAAGCITASANVNARAIRQAYEAWRETDPEARQLQAKITAVRHVLQANPMIPTLKQIVARRLGDLDWLRLRPPLMPLPAGQTAAIETGLEGLGFSLAAR